MAARNNERDAVHRKGPTAEQSSDQRRNNMPGSAGTTSDVLFQPNIPSDKMSTPLREPGTPSSFARKQFVKTLGGTRQQHTTASSQNDKEWTKVVSDKATGRDDPEKHEIHINLVIWKADNMTTLETRHCCKLPEYLKWKFVLNAPTLLSNCKNHFSSSFKTNIRLRSIGMLSIYSTVTNEEEAREIAHKVLDYAVNSLGKDLVINTFEVSEKSYWQALDAINKTADIIQAYAEVIRGKFYVVFRESCGDTVKKVLEAYYLNSSTDNVSVAKVHLEKVLRKFTSVMIESKIIKESRVSIRFESNQDNLLCILEGTPDNVRNAKDVLENLSKELIESKINFPTETTRALHDIHVEDIVNNHLKEKHPACKAEQLQNAIFLYGFEKKELENAKRFVSRLFSECSNLLTGHLRTKAHLVKEHFNSRFKNRMVVHVTSAWRLHMAGLKEAVDEANAEFKEVSEGRKHLSLNDTTSNEANDEFVKNTTSSTRKEVTRSLKLQEPLHFRFLEKSVLLNQVSEKSKVNIYPHQADCTFRISGLDENVTRAVEMLRQIETSVITDSMDISDSESVNYFKSLSSNENVSFYTDKYDVVIEKSVVVSCGKIQIEKAQNIDSSVWSNSLAKLLVLEKFSFETVKADLKFVPTMCDPLRGGRFTEKNSSAGSTLVEMGVPDYIDNGRSVHQTEHVVNKAIEKAVDGNVKSFAFLVSPVANWNLNDLMRCMVHSTVDWLLHSPNQTLRSIRLCTEDQECFSRTDEYIDQCLQTRMSGNTGVHKEKEQPEIRLVKDCLDQAEADVIVNTAASSLDLSYGNVSAALLKAAGTDLQKECWKHFPDGIRHDEIAVTDGYNLKCKRVFHITLQPQQKISAKDDTQSIRKTMGLCLKVASDYKYRSVAFPAIGTGSLRYPADVVASEMIMSIERFVKEDCLSTTIQEVQFVIHPKDTDVFQTFQRMKDKLVTPKNPTLAKNVHVSVHLKIAGIGENVKKCQRILRSRPIDMKKTMTKDTSKCADTSYLQLGQRRNVALSASAVNNRLHVYQYGNVTIRVYEADILNAPVECIVNAANGCLQHSGGIAQRIAEAAGKSLLDECQILVKQRGTIPVTHVVCTTAGNLAYKCVLHAVGPCFTDYNPITESSLRHCAHDLKQTILNCLELAVQNNIQTIVLPTISSGLFLVPKDVCAIQYAHAVMEFSSSSHSLKEIHFVDTSSDMINIIHQTFDAMITQRKLAPFNINVYISKSTADTRGTESDVNVQRMIKSTARDRPKVLTQSTNDKEQNETNAIYISAGMQMQCTFAKGTVPEVKVLIFEGDIINLSGPEAVVCSDNRVGKGKGIIAKLLLEKGGQKYRQEKALQFTARRSYGEVVTTTGGNSNYTWIMHVIVARSDPNAITMLYRKVFEEVQTREYTSVALPLLGTGVGAIGPRSSTEVLYDELIPFCNIQRKTAFTLHVVVKDKAVASIVKSVFQRRIDGMKKKSLTSCTERLLYMEQKTIQTDKDNTVSHREVLKENEETLGNVKDSGCHVRNLVERTENHRPGHEITARSMDPLTAQIQDDSDFDVEPDLPSLEQVLGEDAVKKLKTREKKRQDVINELLYTEKCHVRNLKIMDKLFYQPMLKEQTIPQGFTKSLFPNLETIIKLHGSLNNSMKRRREENSVISAVGDILLQRFDGEAGEEFRNGCAIFCRNQSGALETLKTRVRTERDTADLVSAVKVLETGKSSGEDGIIPRFTNMKAEASPLCQRLCLKDIIPKQYMRLTKYPLMIENLLKYTQTNTEEYSRLERALKCTKRINEYVNKAVKDCENHQRLIDLQGKIDIKSTNNSLEMEKLRRFDVSKHMLLYDGTLTWSLNNEKKIELLVMLLERVMVLLQKNDERLVLKLEKTKLVAGKTDTRTHSPLLWLNNVLVKSVANDEKAFFVVYTSKAEPQVYKLVAQTAEEQKTFTTDVPLPLIQNGNNGH